MKKIDRKKTLLEAKSHLQWLKSLIGKKDVEQKLLKQQIENTESLINAINNNEILIR